MQIDRLSLRGFRNYEDAQAQFVPGVNLLVGGNANGKTNLLEAVSYLSTGRSFRTRREAELIRFGADFAELRAQVQSQERTRSFRRAHERAVLPGGPYDPQKGRVRPPQAHGRRHLPAPPEL